MVFFQNIFKKKDAEFYKNKGLKLIEKQDFMSAIFEFEKGLGLEIGIDDQVFFKKNIIDCKKNLSQHNIKFAETYLNAGDKEQAYEFAENCLRFAEDEDIIEKANGIIKQLDEESIQEKLAIYEKSENENTEDIDMESYYEMIIENYPTFIKEEIDSDSILKEILVAINSGDLEKSSKVFELKDTDTILYLKGLVSFIGEEYEKSFIYYEKLVNLKKEELDEERWVEVVRVIQKTGKGEYLIESLFNEMIGNTLRNAMIEYLLEKRDLKRAKELVDEGLDNMNSDNFNINLVGNAGLVYYLLEDYEIAVGHLSTVRNTAASSGNYVFSPEYAIPLVLSLEKIGKCDDAFELVLHFVKGMDNEKIKEIGIRLSEKSTREDLKKQLKILL